jgi:hypothetical protein
VGNAVRGKVFGERQVVRPPVQYLDEPIGRLREDRFHTALLAPKVTPDRSRRETRGGSDVIPAGPGNAVLPEQVGSVPGNGQSRFGLLLAVRLVDGYRLRLCHLVTSPECH